MSNEFKQYKGKKVLVTGGSGFFASQLVKRLDEAGADIYVVVKYNSVIDNIRLVKLWDKINIVEADIKNADSLTQIKDIAPHYVFHFAAYNHVGDSFLHVMESMQSNAIGSVNMLEAYDGYERFVYIDTSEAYGYQAEVPFTESMTPFPTSPYAVGKYTGELYAQMKHHVSNLPITILRPFNVFGPYQSPKAIIAEVILKCLKGETIYSTEGIQTRDFNYVTNLSDGVLQAALCEKTIGTMTNIGSGVEITIKDLILKIHEYTNSKSELKIGSLDYRPTEIWRMQADNRKAKELFNWSPEVDLDEGLKLTIEWYKKYLEIFDSESSPLFDL
ncbi:MAG: hypothetical protein BM556_09030 [Bacteriovorax sp. MedPE-SWde]|nr:MAG: hypothetical protein BM556_09030 [Bacteriovorax sp. MedPE-SWde]